MFLSQMDEWMNEFIHSESNGQMKEWIPIHRNRTFHIGSPHRISPSHNYHVGRLKASVSSLWTVILILLTPQRTMLCCLIIWRFFFLNCFAAEFFLIFEVDSKRFEAWGVIRKKVSDFAITSYTSMWNQMEPYLSEGVMVPVGGLPSNVQIK